jgi:secretion/DNA translocation related TadE-like protein
VTAVPLDRGAGSVLIVGLVAVVLVAGLTVLGAAHGVVRGQQLAAAADAAALAAADVLLGWVPGEPCAVAQRLAEAHDARLADCRDEGLSVVVRVEASILGLVVARSARAGAAHSLQ